MAAREPAMTSLIKGLHHVTAIAGGARRNLDFYRRTLGLRSVALPLMSRSIFKAPS
jgi:hypothetical protein